jgi:hypothetical protein
MINAFNALLNDWTFIQISRHVMSRRANQLHAALMGLPVRLCAFKAWQERVMNIDGFAR